MSKIYALVYPSYTFCGDGCGDMPALVIIPFHYFAFEKVCGYSLGHQADFFENLDQAKEFMKRRKIDHEARGAVIEMDVNGDELTNICNIHLPKTLDATQEIPNHPGFFQPVKLVDLECRVVKRDEITEHARDELNKQYQSSLSHKMN